MARTLGLEVVRAEIRQADELTVAFDALSNRVDALYIVIDPLVFGNRVRINTLALTARIPAVTALREYVQTGALMSYGPSYPDLFRRTADYVDRILRGAKPGEIPVEQPTRFELVVNQTTAKALRLMIPESFLLRADEVIE